MQRSIVATRSLVAGLALFLVGCDSSGVSPVASASSARYSAFGSYTALPVWSSWCGATSDTTCSTQLQSAVDTPTPESRPRVRAHSWRLWAASWAAIEGAGVNDPVRQRTTLYGTGGCWLGSAEAPECSGTYPIWLTWPNNGRPYTPDSDVGRAEPPPIRSEARPVRSANTLREINRRAGILPTSLAAPNPTDTQTVNTGPVPVYRIPPLVLTKACGIDPSDAAAWLSDTTSYQNIVDACAAVQVDSIFCRGAICDGTAFVNQGDVMVATESLSEAGYDAILGRRLNVADTLHAMYERQELSISEYIPADFISTKHMFWPVKGCSPTAEVGDRGCRVRYGALPPWVPAERRVDYATNAEYLGYEEWGSVVAIDTCGDACPPGAEATLELAHVFNTVSGTPEPAAPITTSAPSVYSVRAFRHIQVSAEALESHFTVNDRALLDQATIWAYGDESNGFEAGDFLVVAAMHINTKELPSWALSSVWWSPMGDALSECPADDYNGCFGQAELYGATAEPGSSQPNPTSGLDATDITSMDGEVGTSWRDYYLLTDSYGIGYQLDGAPVQVGDYFEGDAPPWATTGPSGEELPLLPVSQNPYIEPVIHPLGTNCRNCHQRAAYTPGDPDMSVYAEGSGRSSYQTAQCAFLLAEYGPASSNVCMTNPWAWHVDGINHCQETDGLLCKPSGVSGGTDAFPVLDTDFIWVLPDGHWWPPSGG